MFGSRRKTRVDPDTGELINVRNNDDEVGLKRKPGLTAAIKNAAREAIVRWTSTKS